eukprot:scaffold13929_cov97-Isochrysis_galbana.AAC.8
MSAALHAGLSARFIPSTTSKGARAAVKSFSASLVRLTVAISHADLVSLALAAVRPGPSVRRGPIKGEQRDCSPSPTRRYGFAISLTEGEIIAQNIIRRPPSS